MRFVGELHLTPDVVTDAGAKVLMIIFIRVESLTSFKIRVAKI